MGRKHARILTGVFGLRDPTDCKILVVLCHLRQNVLVVGIFLGRKRLSDILARPV